MMYPPTRPGEYTKVGLESEIRIPALMAIIGAIAADVLILGIFAIWFISLLWLQTFAVAWAWVVKWWGAWAIALLVPWGVFATLLAISFGFQTIDKHWPATRKAREADDGLLSGIFGKGRKRQRKVDEIYDRMFGGDDNDE